MQGRPWNSWIPFLALIAAIAVWLGYAYRALQVDGGIVAQKDQVWVLATVVVGCAIDALVAAAAFRGRVGLGGLLWLGLRALLSVFGFLFLTLPFYAIALILLSQAPSPDGRSDPSLPHAYRPVSAGWFRALTPLWWSRNLLGANQLAASQCVVCQAGRDATIHGPAT
jgi:hypothetical protein